MSRFGKRFQMELRRDVLRSVGYFKEDCPLVIFLLFLMGSSASIAKESDSDFTTTVQRSMSAIVLTQAYGREDPEFKRFGATARKCVRHWFGIHRQELAYRLSVGAIFAVGGALLLTYGGILIHERRLSPGELMIFMTYLGMLYDPLCQITGAAMNLQNGLAGARRVFEVLDRDVVVTDHRKAISLAVEPRTLILENVGFKFDRASRCSKESAPLSSRGKASPSSAPAGGQKHAT